MSSLPPLRPRAPGALAAALFALSSAGVAAVPAAAGDDVPFTVEDRFARPLHERGLQLLDWEGTLANPRVQVVIRPGPEIPAHRYPLRVLVRGSHPRLLLERFSRIGEEGTTKVVHLVAPGDVARFDLTIFPDPDGEDEQHELRVSVEDAAEHPWQRVVPVHVEDRDVAREPGLPILLDFSQDETGFFEDAAHRATLVAAARGLGDLFDAQGFAEVPAGEETSWVWNATGFDGGREVTNPEAYTGFRVLVHGIQHAARHSGSCASDRVQAALQRRGEETLGLRRSGTIAIETSGNWNGRGWHVDGGDPNGWMRSTNLEADAHDLLSVAQHELLHALLYHRAHPAYVEFLRDGIFGADALAAYLGAAPGVDASEHLCRTIDPVSGFGAFGNEYGSVFPWRRWLPTKIDLLALQAVGYRLRPHSCLVALALGPPLAEGVPEEVHWEAELGSEFVLEAGARGGVPPYCFSLAEGALPEGTLLDGWTGTLRGAASAPGTFAFALRVDDQDRTTLPVTRRFTLTLAPAAAAPQEPAADGADPAAAAGKQDPDSSGADGGASPPADSAGQTPGEPPPPADAPAADEPAPGDGASVDGSPGGSADDGVSGDDTPGDGSSNDGRSGSGTSGDGTSGNSSSGDDSSSDGSSNDDSSGSGPSGDSTGGDGTSGDGTSGDGSSGDGTSGEGSSGDGSAGGGTSGDGSGGGTAGDGAAGDGVDAPFHRVGEDR